MRKVFFYLILLLIATVNIAHGQIASTWTVIDSLRSTDPKMVERASKSLGLERGALGLSKVQVLQPCCSKSSSAIFVIALSWEGPIDGYLVLMDSSGKVVEKQRIGYVKSVSLRPLQSEYNDNLIIDAIKGTGSGIRVDWFYIFSLTNIGFHELWNGLSYDKSFPFDMALGQTYEIKGAIDFDDLNDDGIKELIYSKKKIHYSFDPQTQKLSPSKTEKTIEVYKLENGKYVFMKILADQ